MPLESAVQRTDNGPNPNLVDGVTVPPDPNSAAETKEEAPNCTSAECITELNGEAPNPNSEGRTTETVDASPNPNSTHGTGQDDDDDKERIVETDSEAANPHSADGREETDDAAENPNSRGATTPAFRDGTNPNSTEDPAMARSAEDLDE